MNRPMRPGILLLCAACAIVLAFTGCDEDGTEGSGVPVTQDYPLAAFTGISAESGFSVHCEPDSTHAVSVTTDDNLQDAVDVYRSGSALHLTVKPGNDVSFNFLRADVRLPQLSSLVLSAGATCMIGDGFVSDAPFSAVLSAGARAEGTLQCGSFSCVLSAGSNLLLGGEGESGALVATAGSTIDLRAFQLDDASITADGGSVVYVRLDGRLDVAASGGSRVYYKGSAVLGDVSITGGSTLQRVP